MDELAPPRAKALRVALRLEGPAVEDRLAVAVACLDLLAAVAEDEPLLIIVDDAHWIDDASLDALRFAGRRLNADRVGLLFAVRPEGEAAFARSGFDLLKLGALAEADAIEILEALAAFPPAPIRGAARRRGDRRESAGVGRGGVFALGRPACRPGRPARGPTRAGLAPVGLRHADGGARGRVQSRP